MWTSSLPLRGGVILLLVCLSIAVAGCGDTGTLARAQANSGNDVLPLASPGGPDGSSSKPQDGGILPEPSDTLTGPEYAAGPRTPQWALKTSRVLYTDAQIAAARQLCSTDAGAIAIKNRIIQEAAYWLTIPPTELFLRLPDSRVPRAYDVSGLGCPIHGDQIFKFSQYPWILDRDHPFILECPIGHEKYPSNDFEAYYKSGMKDDSLLTGPYADNGWGWVSPSGEKYWFVAYACHWHWKGTWMPPDKGLWLPAVTTLSQAYALTGDKAYARQALVMLDRIAQVYPAMDYATQSRTGQMCNPEDSQGKILDHLWEAVTLRDLAIAYDLVFDAMAGENGVSLPWRSAREIQENIAANLLEEGIDAVGRRQIYGSHQSALALAAVVRQNGPTAQIIDNLFTQPGSTYLDQGFGYALYNLTTKDGAAGCTSPNYNALWVNNVVLLNSGTAAANRSLYNYSKMPSLFDMPVNLLCNSEFIPAEGDSGSIDSGWSNDVPAAAAYADAYRNLPDRRSRYAWILQRLGALTDPTYKTFEQLFQPPIVKEVALAEANAYEPKKLPSRVFDGYGMAILNNTNDSIGVSMFYGFRANHGHNDRLNIEIFGHGRRLSPDLGYPDAMNEFVSGIYSWTKNTISHNTVMIDESKQLGNVNGKVLRFHNAPSIHVVDVDAAGSYTQAGVYRRTLVLVDVGTDDGYLVDVFRVQGGNDHVLSLHGQDGVFELTGADLPEPVTDGTLAGSDVAYGQLYDDPRAGTPGYHNPQYAGSGYSHLFNWQSIIPDQGVTGHWTLSGTPAANLHLHVPLHAGQELVVADAYASPRQRIPAVLKYMLLRRPGTADGNTFVVVWELANTPIIDDIVVNDDPALGTGKDQAVVLSVRRGNIVDTIAVAPEAGTDLALSADITSDAAVAFLSRQDGQWGRRLAAGGSYLSANNPELAVAIPEIISGPITTVDYTTRTLTAEVGNAPLNTDQLLGHAVRIYNDSHSALYSVLAARRDDTILTLKLGSSDVFTGRIKLATIDTESKKVTTPILMDYGSAFNRKGMSLVTADYAHSAKIVSADDRGCYQLADDADLAPFADDMAAGRDSWIADFGVGDHIEIERCVFAP